MPRNAEEVHDELTPELIAEHKKLNQFHAATERKGPYHEFLVNFPLQAAVILRTGTLRAQLRAAKDAALLQQASNPKGPKRTGGIDRKPADGTRYAAVVEAVRSGAVEDLAELLSAGVTVDSRSSSSRTALMYAIMEKRAECVEMLLRAGADVKAVDAAGMSVLHWASLCGDVELVKLLAGKGAEAWALNMGKMRPHEVMVANDPRSSSSLTYSVLTKAIIKKQVSIVEAYLEAIYNRGRGLNHASLAVNFSSKGRSFGPGSGLKSNQNITNLPSFLGLWDLYWEKIVVLKDNDGTLYKCDVTLKLSRKTTVDLIAGKYEVIGFKRGTKPYKKFRDCGMIELKLEDNVIQSELVDVATDVEQPRAVQDEKGKKKKKTLKEGKANESAVVDTSDADTEYLISLVDDMISILIAGENDYPLGIARLLISGILDEVEDMDHDALKKVEFSDAIQGEYSLVSESNAAVANVIEAVIVAVERMHNSAAEYDRPMSSGVCVSLVMESLLQVVESGSVAIRARIPRMRLEGPIIDLRSLPWEQSRSASKT